MASSLQNVVCCVQLNELEHVPEKNEREIGELTIREEKLSKDLQKETAEMEKTMAGLKAETQELQDSKNKLQTQLIGLKKTVDEAKSDVSYPHCVNEG